MGWMHQWLPSPHSGASSSHAAAPADAAAEDSWSSSMFSQLHAGASTLPLQHTDDNYMRALLTQQQQQQRRHAHLEHSHALFPPPFSATTPTDRFSRPNTSPLHLLDDQLLQVRALAHSTCDSFKKYSRFAVLILGDDRFHSGH